MALYGLVFLGSTPLGGPFLGWVSGRWGGRWGLALSGVVSLAAALVAAAPAVSRGWRTVRARAGAEAGGGVDRAGLVDVGQTVV
jgi:hypothetical protein